MGLWSWVTTGQQAVKCPISMVGEILTVSVTGRIILVELSQGGSRSGMLEDSEHRRAYYLRHLDAW